MAKKKPVIPGRRPQIGGRRALATVAEKNSAFARLINKGVPPAVASRLVGQGEEIDRGTITLRRIEWQRELPKKV